MSESFELCDLSPSIDLTKDEYKNPFSAPTYLPNILLLNVSTIVDPHLSLVTMHHASTFWPTDQPAVPGIPCQEGTMFLFRSTQSFGYINTWESSSMYVTVLISGDPLATGPPIVNLHMQQKEAVKLISESNPYGCEFYDHKPESKERCNWNNPDYYLLWHQKAHNSFNNNYWGYKPDPLSPRGCAQPQHTEPPSIITHLRCTKDKNISVVARTNSHWFSMGVNCSPNTACMKMPQGTTNLQQAKCSCPITTLDKIFTAPFEMIRREEDVIRILKYLI